MGYKAKWEYFRAVYERYRKAGREAKHLMLNEFCLNTGYHRKYAIRLLNGPCLDGRPQGYIFKWLDAAGVFSSGRVYTRARTRHNFHQVHRITG